MKSRSLLVVSGILLFLVAGSVPAQQSPQQTQEQAQPSGQTAIAKDANMSAQSTSDTSYGGMPDTRSQASGTRLRHCATGPQCDIFFGQ